MLLPDKHIRLGESLLGVGAEVLRVLSNGGPASLDLLVATIQSGRPGQSLAVVTSEVILALDVLYAVELIDTDDGGRVVRCA